MSRRVLIVEDQPDGREALRLLVESCGHEVQTAADGPAGLQQALSWQPEVAVIDIGLPSLDGYELARSIRVALSESMFLIALTAYGKAGEALANGFDVHLTKPADPDKLCRLIASCADRT
jgi:CheY-like chemotaxis protein